MGKKGRLVFTDGEDEAALAEGARDAYLKRNLRYSQLAPISMFEETNTRNNMPAQVEIYAEGEDAYKFLFIAKGGGSANKSFLFQATPSILTHDRHAGVPQGKGAHARHRGVPALSPRDRDRRHLGRAHDEDGEARLDEVSRRPADGGLGGRPRLPRPRDGAGNPQDDAVARGRRAVRRQIFLPRRARDPPAAPRRLAADRARRVVLGRPPGARQDHPRRRLPRGARAQSGAVPARRRRREARRRGGQGRPQPADEGNSRDSCRNIRSRRGFR